MMKKFSIISIILLFVMMLPIMVACGGDDEPDNGGGSLSFLVGEWQECDPYGSFKNDATDREVMHVKFNSGGTGQWWNMDMGKMGDYSFTYTGSINGTSGTLTITITSCTIASVVGQTSTAPFSYVNGILHAGEIYYKKK